MNFTVVFFIVDFHTQNSWVETFEEKNADDPMHAIRRARNRLNKQDMFYVEYAMAIDERNEFYLDRAWW